MTRVKYSIVLAQAVSEVGKTETEKRKKKKKTAKLKPHRHDEEMAMPKRGEEMHVRGWDNFVLLLHSVS